MSAFAWSICKSFGASHATGHAVSMLCTRGEAAANRRTRCPAGAISAATQAANVPRIPGQMPSAAPTSAEIATAGARLHIIEVQPAFSEAGAPSTGAATDRSRGDDPAAATTTTARSTTTSTSTATGAVAAATAPRRADRIRRSPSAPAASRPAAAAAARWG